MRFFIVFHISRKSHYRSYSTTVQKQYLFVRPFITACNRIRVPTAKRLTISAILKELKISRHGVLSSLSLPFQIFPIPAFFTTLTGTSATGTCPINELLYGASLFNAAALVLEGKLPEFANRFHSQI